MAARAGRDATAEPRAPPWVRVGVHDLPHDAVEAVGLVLLRQPAFLESSALVAAGDAGHVTPEGLKARRHPRGLAAPATLRDLAQVTLHDANEVGGDDPVAVDLVTPRHRVAGIDRVV